MKLNKSTTYTLTLNQDDVNFLYDVVSQIQTEQDELGGSEFGDTAGQWFMTLAPDAHK